jgi:hypothetical protein
LLAHIAGGAIAARQLPIAMREYEVGPTSPFAQSRPSGCTVGTTAFVSPSHRVA